MKRAVMAGNGVEWYETCYCTPPLHHERSTVYDQFFEDMKIKPLTSLPRLEGGRFWKYLRDHSKDNENGGQEIPAVTQARYIPIRIL